MQIFKNSDQSELLVTIRFDPKQICASKKMWLSAVLLLWSSKVDDFGTNRKRVYDFLLVGVCDYDPILHCFQRWSPRGHGLGLEAPRGQLVMSLALALASENMYLLLIIFALCA